MILPIVFLCSPLACSDSVTTSPASISAVASLSDSLAPITSITKFGVVRIESAPPKGRAELPRVILDFPYPATPGRTIAVRAGDNLQSALDRARRGDQIVLEGAARFTGNFTLPVLNGTAADGWVVIRGDKSDRLPALGTRVTPNDGILMPMIITPNTAPAIRAESGTSGWRLVGLEITASPALTDQQYGLVVIGQNGAGQRTLASAPSDIVLDRMYIHGQPTTNLSRCVALNSARTSITDSHLGECHGRGFDSQAIAGWNGPGPFQIVNNYLEGAGENVMFGGGDPSIPGLVPSDIEIRRNHFYTPAAWKNVWLKKNLLEFKNAVRVLVEGNVFDGSWKHGQTGWAVVIKSANQSGNCRWCRSTDITFRKNLFRNAGAGINIAARDDNPATDTTARRVVISENVLDDIGTGMYDGDKRGFQLLTGTAEVAIERNVLAGNLTAALLLGKSPGTSGATFRNNVWARGVYGVIADGRSPGMGSLAAGAPGATWSNNTLIGPMQAGYPVGTFFRATESSVDLAREIRGIVARATEGVVGR